MLRGLLTAFALLLFSTAVICGQKAASSITIYQDKDYSRPLIPLKELVNQRSTTKTNTFFISNVFQPDSGSTHVWVYWKEKNALILWEKQSFDPKNELVWSRRFLRFGKEIVPPNRFVEGTNYMLLTKDGNDLKRECLKGTKIVVNNTSRKK